MRTPPTPPTQRIVTVVAALGSSLLLLFLVAPIAELVTRGAVSGIRSVGSDDELRNALLLTALTATAATICGILGGTPLAYYLARTRSRLAGAVAAVLDLPLLIPHPVAGVALLLVLGRESAVGGALLKAGIGIVSTPLGIVAAMLFVSAPLFVSGAREAFARVDRRYEGVARTLGDPPLRVMRRVTLPLAMRGLVASAVVMWARAVSEFGAIVILTYNPKTVSVLSYDRFTSFGLSETIPVAAALVLFALVPLVVLRLLRYERRLDQPW